MIATFIALVISLGLVLIFAWLMYIPYFEGEKDMTQLDIDATTVQVSARALNKFKEDYPNREAVWVKAVQGKLDIKISSVSKKSGNVVMRHHIYFNKTDGLMEV